jgi:hypothetical protein
VLINPRCDAVRIKGLIAAPTMVFSFVEYGQITIMPLAISVFKFQAKSCRAIAG